MKFISTNILILIALVVLIPVIVYWGLMHKFASPINIMNGILNGAGNGANSDGSNNVNNNLGEKNNQPIEMKDFVYPKQKAWWFSKFDLKYPSNWTIQMEGVAEDENFGLVLSTTKGDRFTVIQGENNGGECLYEDSVNYKDFIGNGVIFDEYISIDKGDGLEWRLSKYSIKDQNLTHALCEKFGDRYLDATKIGYTKIYLVDKQSEKEFVEILKSVKIK